MSQVPPSYTPQASFADLATQPIVSAGLPGPQLDAEFSRSAASINQTISRLAELQRDDGALRNGVVSLSAMAPDVYALLISLGVNPVIWAPGIQIKKGDLVSNPSNTALRVTGPLFCDGEAIAFPDLDYYGGRLWSDGSGRVCSWMLDGPQWELYDLNAEQLAKWTSPDNVDFPGDATFFPQNLSTGTPSFEIVAGPATRGTYLAIADHATGPSIQADLDKWALIAAKPEAGDLVVNSFVSNGAGTVYGLSVAPLDEANTFVYFDGVYQSKSTYSVSGSTLTLSVAAPDEALIEIVCGVPVQKSILTTADGSVSADKLQTYSVTTPKLAPYAVTTDKLANDSVATAHLILESVTAAKLAPGSVSAEKIQAGAVDTGSLATAAVTGDKLESNAVGSSHLAGGAVTSAKIAAGPLLLNGTTDATTGKHLVTKEWLERAGSVSAAMIADGAVATAGLANAGVTGAKLSKVGNLPCQIQRASKTGIQTLASGSWVDVTGLDVSITRVNLTSKVRVQAVIACSSDSGHPVAFRLQRNSSTPVGVGGASGSKTEACAAGGANAGVYGVDSVAIDFVDDISGSGTATHNYKVQARIASGAGYINRSTGDSDAGTSIRAASSLTLTELAG